ncbi:MAG: hypothetical protein AABY09_00375 [Nanoarchaeota archaeon]
MNRPKSTFCTHAMNSAFFVIEDSVYQISKSNVKGGNGIVDITSMPVRLDVLEKIYFSDLRRRGYLREDVRPWMDESRNMKLVRFIVEDVLGNIYRGYMPHEGASIISKVIPKDGILVRCGSWYAIYEDMGGTVRVNGRRYSAQKNPCAIEHLERKYQAMLDDALFPEDGNLEGIAGKAHYYDKEKEIGFLIEDGDFYVFTEVRPYALYERSNGAYYQFGKARVGSRLSISDGYIEWGCLQVMDSYSHPSLPENDKAYQQVCVGGFSYESIIQKYPGDARMQIMELMRKGRKVLTTEYTSHERSWHKLTESTFAAKKLSCGSNNVVALNY